MATRSPAPSSSSDSTLIDVRNVKKEVPDDEIKDFAETAMNELLGWYGYDKRGSPPQPRTLPQTQSPQNDECAWCNNPITDANSVTQSMGEKFCSEVCFSQSRRATFKRAKTCDWCRHVRHTVSYVDFQDGATQLQFCSDKCLNQYKMHIFCRETQAHLDLNPHLVGSGSSNTNLITPELWMKNCKSPSNSPTSEHSKSPTAERSASPLKTSPEKSPTLISSTPTTSGVKPMPLITVAPTSKLMKAKVPEEKHGIMSSEARREHRMMKANMKKRRSSRNSQKMSLNNPKPQDLSMPDSSMVHDEPINSIMKQNIISPPPGINPRLHPPNMPRPFFNFQPVNNLFNMNQDQFQAARFLPPQMFPHPNMLNPPVPPPPPTFQQTNDQFRPNLPFLQNNLGTPPVTVLVPYPVVLPIPFPIPIPLPLASFLKAHETSLPPRKTECSNGSDGDFNEPLDFTMNHEKDKKESPRDDSVETNSTDIILNSHGSPSPEKEMLESTSPENNLPKFKITKHNNKLAKTLATRNREFSESTRPLRKRRRLVENSSEDECNGVLNKSRKTVPV